MNRSQFMALISSCVAAPAALFSAVKARVWHVTARVDIASIGQYDTIDEAIRCRLGMKRNMTCPTIPKIKKPFPGADMD